MDDESNEFLLKEKCKAKEDEELLHNFTSKWIMESMCKKNPDPELLLLFFIYKCWCKHSCVINCACWIETKIKFHDCFKSKHIASTCCTSNT